jgi:hypothetical protein
MLTIHQPGTSSGRGELTPWVFTQEQIAPSWEELEVFIARSVEKSKGTITVAAIQESLLAGHATAFATARNGKFEAVLVVRIVDYLHYRAARIIACAGKNLREAKPFAESFEAWALTQGAVEIEAFCRPAVSRLLRYFGYEIKFNLVSKDLRRKLQ